MCCKNITPIFSWEETLQREQRASEWNQWNKDAVNHLLVKSRCLYFLRNRPQSREIFPLSLYKIENGLWVDSVFLYKSEPQLKKYAEYSSQSGLIAHHLWSVMLLLSPSSSLPLVIIKPCTTSMHICWLKGVLDPQALIQSNFSLNSW